MSFSDYMDSLGARKIPVAMNSTLDTGRSNDQQQVYSYSNTPYGIGQQIPGLSGRQQAEYNNKGYGSGIYDGYKMTPGYVDSGGGFLGYGSNYGALQKGQLNNQYADYAANEPGRLADVEAKNIANQQARLQYEQDYQAAQAAKLAAQAQQPHFQGQGLVGMGQAPQQSSMGRGSGFAPGQQYAGGMGRGSGAGLIGGMGRGGGQ